MLGVAPDSGHDEIRRAYTARAFALHPDRLGPDATDAEREAAAWRMAEVNAAWWVLGNPSRRADFDLGRERSRRPGSAAGAAPGDRRDTAPAEAPYPPENVPDLEPEVAGAPTVIRRPSRWRVYGPVIVAGVLVVVVVFVLIIASVSAPPDPENVETTGLFPVGSCVQITPARTVVPAACDATGAVTVLGREPFPQPCPPRTAAIVMLELNESICVEQPAPGTP